MSPDQPNPRPTESELIGLAADMAACLHAAGENVSLQGERLPKMVDMGAILTHGLTGVMPFVENTVLDSQYETLCAKAGDLGFLVRREEGYTSKELAISVRHVAAVNDVHISLQQYTNLDRESDKPYLYIEVSQAEAALEVFSMHATFNALVEHFKSYPTYVHSDNDADCILPTNYGACPFFGVSRLDSSESSDQPVESFGLYVHVGRVEEVMERTFRCMEIMAQIILEKNPMLPQDIQSIVKHDSELRVLRESHANSVHQEIVEKNDPEKQD